MPIKKTKKKPVKKTKKLAKKPAAKKTKKKVTKLRVKPKPKPRAKPKLGNDPMSAYGTVTGRIDSGKSNLSNFPRSLSKDPVGDSIRDVIGNDHTYSKPLALGPKVAEALKKVEQLITAPKIDYVPGADEGAKGVEATAAAIDDQALADEFVEDAEELIREIESTDPPVKPVEQATAEELIDDDDEDLLPDDDGLEDDENLQ